VIGLSVEYFDHVPVARPQGDIDAANATRVRAQLAHCMGNDADSLVLDLGETRYLDSAAVDMLFRLNERLRQRRLRLRLVIPPDSQLLRLAELVGIPRAIPLYASVDEALEVCKAVHEQSGDACSAGGSKAGP
jgi:stage II sporulation protein AA (anti-sigma F factor antagonist)